MESGFMMALDYMINLAEKDQDDKRKSLLEVIKETILSHLTKKCPPHVQVVGCYVEPLGKKADMITYALIKADWSNLEALHIHIIFVGDMIPLSSTEQFLAGTSFLLIFSAKDMNVLLIFIIFSGITWYHD
ncbi:unnamed protein product [Lactuca saligna]|uniref:Uncharacterized protein n=1 Tax=Lactuca saligna TaxID=75948 RepID=A0AA35Z1H7_LACSI|nr:unnamed protein product [Lactuca saligna]